MNLGESWERRFAVTSIRSAGIVVNADSRLTWVPIPLSYPYCSSFPVAHRPSRGKMRLLFRNDEGEYRLKNFDGNDLIPDYAILSHT